MTLSSSIRQLARRLSASMGVSSEDNLVLGATRTLKRTDLLQDVPLNYLRDLARMMHYRDYRRDEYVYHDNDPGLGLYIVQRGRVRLMARDEDGPMHVLREVKEHQMFGEASLIGEFRRQETAQVSGETRLLGFFRPDFKALSKRHPQAAVAIAMALAAHIVKQQEQLIRRLSVHDGKVAAIRVMHQKANESELTDPIKYIS